MTLGEMRAQHDALLRKAQRKAKAEAIKRGYRDEVTRAVLDIWAAKIASHRWEAARQAMMGSTIGRLIVSDIRRAWTTAI